MKIMWGHQFVSCSSCGRDPEEALNPNDGGCPAVRCPNPECDKHKSYNGGPIFMDCCGAHMAWQAANAGQI